MGISKNPIDGRMGDQAIPRAFQFVEEDDIQRISDPVRSEDHIVLQRIVILVATTEADTQVVEPVEQILLVVINLSSFAN